MQSMDSSNKKSLEDYWNKRWEIMDTPWLRDKVNVNLVKHFTAYFPDNPPKKAFVPLCGKTTDLLWLAKQGCEVVGVELNIGACEDFFKEHQLKYHSYTSGGCPIFKSSAYEITIYNCNLFDFPRSEVGKFDFIWDRGSFVAVPKSTRHEYYSMIKSLYAENFHHLIESSVYDENEFKKFPTRLTFDHVAEIIGNERFKLELLEEIDVLDTAEVKFKQKFSYFKSPIFMISKN